MGAPRQVKLPPPPPPRRGSAPPPPPPKPMPQPAGIMGSMPLMGKPTGGQPMAAGPKFSDATGPTEPMGPMGPMGLMGKPMGGPPIGTSAFGGGPTNSAGNLMAQLAGKPMGNAPPPSGPTMAPSKPMAPQMMSAPPPNMPMGSRFKKGGAINLKDCKVSTHTPSKKNANW